MGLNLGGGDFKPYVKFNAKADKWFVKEGEGEKEVKSPTFIADLPNIKTGWFYYKAGQAPLVVLDKSLSDPAPNPGLKFTDENGKERNCYNRGFKLDLFSNASFGGVVEWSANSMTVNGAVSALYDLYEKDAAANPGLLPVVEVTGSTALKNEYGTNYQPTFKIVKWVARPAELSGVAATVATAANANPAAAAPAKASVSEF